MNKSSSESPAAQQARHSSDGNSYVNGQPVTSALNAAVESSSSSPPVLAVPPLPNGQQLCPSQASNLQGLNNLLYSNLPGPQQPRSLIGTNMAEQRNEGSSVAAANPTNRVTGNGNGVSSETSGPDKLLTKEASSGSAVAAPAAGELVNLLAIANAASQGQSHAPPNEARISSSTPGNASSEHNQGESSRGSDMTTSNLKRPAVPAAQREPSADVPHDRVGTSSTLPGSGNAGPPSQIFITTPQQVPFQSQSLLQAISVLPPAAQWQLLVQMAKSAADLPPSGVLPHGQQQVPTSQGAVATEEHQVKAPASNQTDNDTPQQGVLGFGAHRSVPSLATTVQPQPQFSTSYIPGLSVPPIAVYPQAAIPQQTHIDPSNPVQSQITNPFANPSALPGNPNLPFSLQQQIPSTTHIQQLIGGMLQPQQQQQLVFPGGQIHPVSAPIVPGDHAQDSGNADSSIAAHHPRQAGSRLPVLLSLECDDQNLSPYQCLIRQQIGEFRVDYLGTNPDPPIMSFGLSKVYSIPAPSLQLVPHNIPSSRTIPYRTSVCRTVRSNKRRH